MKNFLIVILLAVVAYKGYTTYSQKKSLGAFDENGNPLALLFTIADCGPPCGDVKDLLDRRQVAYEEIQVTPGGENDARWKEFGSVRSAPFLVVGDERIIGSDMLNITFTVGSLLGRSHLNTTEAEILDKNFAADGAPKLVMYSMDGCGYCEAAANYFQQQGMRYEERNASVDPVAAREFKALRSGTPVIFFGHKVFIGWDAKVRDQLSALTSKAG